VVSLRLLIAAFLLIAVCRPRVRGYDRADLLVVGGFGVALAAMNVLIYQAIERIPLGVAVTVEVLGPLALSVIAGRRLSSWLWAALALGGVILLGKGGVDGLDPVGLGFAAAAATMWAAYILLSARVGTRLMSLGPVIAALAGYVVLDQALAPAQLLAIALVVAAGVGAVRTQRESETVGDRD